MQTLGIIDLFWRGENIPVEKGSSIRLGGIKNNTVTLSRAVGRAQEFQGTEVKAKTILRKGQSALDLFSEEEGELQVVCDTGQTYVIPDAFLTGDRPTMTGGEGGAIDLTWAGSTAQEVI